MGRSRCRCIRANLSSRIKVRRKWNRKPLSSRSVCVCALLIEWATACTGERLQLKFAFDVHASESQTSHALAYTSSLSINLPTLPLYLSTDSNGTNQPSPLFYTYICQNISYLCKCPPSVSYPKAPTHQLPCRQLSPLLSYVFQSAIVNLGDYRKVSQLCLMKYVSHTGRTGGSARALRSLLSVTSDRQSGGEDVKSS